METIVHYFEHIPSLHRAIILAGGISFSGLSKALFRFLVSAIINGSTLH